MYKTEAEFSKALSVRLRHAGIDVTRIESHGTGNGIPDMFIQCGGWDTFLELKNKPKSLVQVSEHVIDWRPGQQAWLYNYYLKHAKRKCCLTVQACSNGLLIIPHVATYSNDKYIGPGITWDELKHINLRQILRVMSNCKTYEDCKTYREALNMFMEDEYDMVDYDPEVLWPAETIDNKFILEVWQCNLLEIISQLSYYQK